MGDPRRCQTDLCDIDGDCIACGAVQGERCRLPIQRSASPGQRGGDVGKVNYATVRAWFLARPCASNREAAAALSLSIMAIGRHVKKIRAEWLK